jgi:hypothetical protein
MLEQLELLLHRTTFSIKIVWRGGVVFTSGL